MFKVEAQRLVDAVADTVGEQESKTLSENWPM